MSLSLETGSQADAMRARIAEIDARIQQALVERVAAESDLLKTRAEAGTAASRFDPDRDADIMRQMVERHRGEIPLAAMEHIWRDLIGAAVAPEDAPAIHLDGSADLIEMLDLARFYFGFAADLMPGSDAADVVGAVSDAADDLGLVALSDRADLPWWRGLSEAGACIRARLPFVVLDDRPADLPALVLSKCESLIDKSDIAVYDARWSDLLPGRLMDQGIEVLSFFRSANGVDALIAVAGDLPEDAVRSACAEAGAVPDVLRRVGGYPAPIDGGSDPDDVFDPAEGGDQG